VNEDFLDLLRCLLEAGARFLVVGAHALAAHGIPRATGDLDVWIDRTPTNVERVWAALVRFGAPVAALGVTRSDFEAAGMTVQIGLPPRRIDLMTEITGVAFDEALLEGVTAATAAGLLELVQALAGVTESPATA